ncbi:MAG: hypothetical protein A2788_02460 [Candidatus Abawacabacteria bacterium RIFCSPHIGHO2_01_FULL_46_8]|uniref:VWA domain-containing protein n=1 Tax=Candidatus Abawacabacteria bacterium RIFCSPHIGHO2_01_FULL_46_8 TaxID=1817815 RepID=A0A1F4XM76_9BACT|nr:MAG: hypothetical protein A2788_02460 [Candidatus Abawacabacteria bacterium RIFCSPHIGHO2_01_FULL_46_8]
MKKPLVLLVLALFFLAHFNSGTQAFADGLIIIEPPSVPPLIPDTALAVKEHQVKVEIKDAVATTSIEQIFSNPNDRIVEGTYLFPIPEAAAISNFTATWQGEELKGEVLPKDEARKIYQAIVRRQLDPALLEYVGTDLFRARIFPLGPKETRNFKLVYSELVPLERGTHRYRYPLNTERFSSQKLERVSIEIKIKMSQAIKNIYSPSHKLKIERQGEEEVTALYQDEQVKPDQDFWLSWSTSGDDVGLNLLTYQATGEDAYFILLASPKMVWSETKVLAKDIVLVLDVSGSMKGVKLAQAKEALKYVVSKLNPADRFATIYFNDAVTRMQADLVTVDQQAISKVSKEIDQIEAGGPTDIDAALKAALRYLKTDTERPQTVVFLTDGEPTAGLTETGEIVRDIRASNLAGAKIFTFGVGNDVNAHLLDFIAGDSRGVTTYVAPNENITDKVSEFYDKIASPLLEKLALQFKGADVYDLYPKELPDLYQGSQLIIVGRYKTAADDQLIINLSAGSEGKKQEFTSPPYLLGKIDTSIGEIPLIWATRKVGYLLNQIRLHGENKELVDEVIRLSRLYGIINEYTSFLIDLDPELPLSEQLKQGVSNFSKTLGEKDFAAPIGVAGTGAAKSTQTLQGATSLPLEITPRDQQTKIKRVGAKIFYLINNRWVDAAYHGGKSLLAIKYDSSAYNQILTQLNAGPYLALGKSVIICLKDNCYEIGAVGESDLSDLEVFQDVAALHWSSKYFRALKAAGALSGTATGQALPDQAITRAELLKIVLKLAGIEPDQADLNLLRRLTDVQANTWYGPLVATAIAKGIVSGYSDGSFRPNRLVTRVEALKIMFKAFMVSVEGIVPEDLFKDVKADDWFAPYLSKATSLGIVAGYQDNNFRPQLNISRAEAAKIIVEAKQAAAGSKK